MKNSHWIRLPAFILAVIALTIGMSACFDNPLEIEGYEVIGEAVITETQPFDFTKTLLELYPSSDAVVLATLKGIDGFDALFIVEDNIRGNIQPGSEFIAKHTLTKMPAINQQYLLFLKQQAGQQHLLFDNAGWLRVNGDVIFPSGGGTYSFEQARSTIARLNDEILLPAQFNYHRGLIELVSGCDAIFIGTVKTIVPGIEKKFFSRSSGIEESVSEKAKEVFIDVEQVLVGKISNQAKLLMTPSMLNNVIVSENLEPRSYTENDAPELTEGSRYLFFTINPPIRDQNHYLFCVNPVQGYVELNGDSIVPVQTNLVYNYPQNLSEVILDIEDIVEAIKNDEPVVEYYEFADTETDEPAQ